MSDKSRRKLLQSIALGSGAVIAGKSLPESWSRPVVDSVMLPAHAQTSGLVFGGTGLVAALDTDDQTMMAQVVDSLVPEAEAADHRGEFGWYTCCIVAGDMVDVTLAGLNWCNGSLTGMIRQGLIPMDGKTHTINATAWAVNCDGFPNDGEKIATVSVAPQNVSSSQITLTVYPRRGDRFNLIVPFRTGCLPLPPLYDCDVGCDDT